MKKFMTVFLPIIMALLIPHKAFASQDTCISQTAQDACVEYGEKYNICAEVLMAVAERESGGKSDAVGGECIGIMQINPDCHRERMKRLGVTDLFDERGNILVAADYLAELFGEYGEIYSALMCYNMGEAGAKKLFDKGIYESRYAVEICERSAELEEMHGK